MSNHESRAPYSHGLTQPKEVDKICQGKIQFSTGTFDKIVKGQLITSFLTVSN